MNIPYLFISEVLNWGLFFPRGICVAMSDNVSDCRNYGVLVTPTG